MIEPTTLADWRSWLAEHAATEREVWLVLRRGGVSYAEAVEQALCFGWVDGLHRKLDDTASTLRFTPRKPSSAWSASNRERVERMIATGQMTPAGQAMVDLAKETGTWLSGEVVPDDLAALLAENPTAQAHFAAFPPSSRHTILSWIASAKRPETRQRRLRETVELAAQNLRANHR
ncbi:YdeI family protein [Actinokineospora soli]|uniref:YdeI family protein n=1 Tax=Actinokineospora soli TaxID=1048753 RepID=A0ABW2TI44_9PSEU